MGLPHRQVVHLSLTATPTSFRPARPFPTLALAVPLCLPSTLKRWFFPIPDFPTFRQVLTVWV